MIVADANLISNHVVEGESTVLAELCRRRDPTWTAPSIWRSELLNAISKYVRSTDQRNYLSVLEALQSMAWADALVRPADAEPTHEEVLQISRDLRISGYNSHYVALARRRGVRCVTSDQQMLTRASDVCVSIVDYATGR